MPPAHDHEDRRPSIADIDLAKLEDTGELAGILIDGLPGAGLLVVAADLRILMARGEVHRRIGTDRGVGRPVNELMAETSWRELRPRYERALRGEVQLFEFRTPLGRVHKVRMAPVRDGAVVTGLIVLSQDVTGEVDAPHRLRAEADAPREFLQATLDSLHAHIAVLDAHGDILMTNRAWKRFAEHNGGGTNALSGNYLAACDAADDPHAARVANGLRAMIAGRTEGFSHEYPCHGPGRERWFRLQAAPFEGPGEARVVLSHEDVTARRQAEREVQRQAMLLDEVDAAVVATDAGGRVTHWNHAAERLFGWRRSEALGRRGAEVVKPADLDRARAVMEQLRRDGAWEGELAIRRKDGSVVPAYVRDRVLTDDRGELTGLIGVSIDISSRVAVEKELRTTRNYLTTVTDSVAEGLYTLDADGRVTYLNKAAERLLGWRREQLIGRIMHDITHFRRPDGSAFPIEACPIVQARRGGTVVRVEEDLFIRADGRELAVAYTAAPFLTPEGTEGCVVVFEDISERQARQRELERDAEKLAWIRRVQTSLVEGRFELYGQPIVELAGGAVVQHELLLRMHNDDGSVETPGAFLPIAEEYGLIGDIDRWVVGRATELAARGLPVELNVSGRSIGDPLLLKHIERRLAVSGADPRLLVFEITETALVDDEESALRFAEHLHALGCKLALDDFGTGYGGFTYLKRLPVDLLKIDREFVRDLTGNPASRHVVEAVVALARGFGLQTVAEGVEDRATLDLLRALGVDMAQGYFIARPRPIEEDPSGDR